MLPIRSELELLVAREEDVGRISPDLGASDALCLDRHFPRFLATVSVSPV